MKHPTNRFKHAFVVTALSLFISACTQHDPITGDVIPQGNQRYTFSEVKRRTANLIPGMSRRDVLIRLGSPAHRAGDDWVYLPERPGVGANGYAYMTAGVNLYKMLTSEPFTPEGVGAFKIDQGWDF